MTTTAFGFSVGLLLSLVVSAAGNANFTDGGSNTACREFSGSACQDPCIKYTHVTQIATLSECQDLCSARQSCTGVEYNAGMTRCEVWHTAIGHFKTNANGFQCFNYSGPAKVDIPLYVVLLVEVTGANLSKTLAAGPTILDGLRTVAKATLASLNGSATADQVKQISVDSVIPEILMLPEKLPKGVIRMSFMPGANVDALALYSVWRGSNPDSIPDAATPFTLGLSQLMSNYSSGGQVTFAITSRSIVQAWARHPNATNLTDASDATTTTGIGPTVTATTVTGTGPTTTASTLTTVTGTGPTTTATASTRTTVTYTGPTTTATTTTTPQIADGAFRGDARLALAAAAVAVGLASV